MTRPKPIAVATGILACHCWSIVTCALLLHDPKGNVIFDGAFVYQYDAWNRLVQVNEPGTAVFNPVENANGSGSSYECPSADCSATAAADGCSDGTSRSKTRAVRAIPLPPWAIQR